MLLDPPTRQHHGAVPVGQARLPRGRRFDLLARSPVARLHVAAEFVDSRVVLGNFARQLSHLLLVLSLRLGQLAAPALFGKLMIGQSLLEPLPCGGALSLVPRFSADQPGQGAWPGRLEVLPHRG
ncbi:MAG: hypothetical protein ACRDRW_12440 [Pseudonocardiaceae bacterium]